MGKGRMSLEKGSATLVYVSILAVVCVVVLGMSFSRLALVSRRNETMSGRLSLGYLVESEVNDLAARAMGGYVGELALVSEEKKVGRMKVEAKGRESGGGERVEVTGKVGTTTSRLELVKVAKTQVAGGSGKVVLVMDCSVIMDGYDGRVTTRIEEQKKAVFNLVEKLGREGGKIGLAVYDSGAEWLRTENGLAVTPELGIANSERLEVISSNFGNRRSNSIGCGMVRGYPESEEPWRVMNELLQMNQTTEEGERKVVLIKAGKQVEVWGNDFEGQMIDSYQFDDASELGKAFQGIFSAGTYGGDGTFRIVYQGQ